MLIIVVSVNVDDFNTSRFNIGALIVNSRMTNAMNIAPIMNIVTISEPQPLLPASLNPYNSAPNPIVL